MIRNHLHSLEVHALLFEEVRFFVLDHALFHLNVVEFLNFDLNLVGIFLEYAIIPNE